MPTSTSRLNAHSYLESYGWKGKGFALNKGGLERPILTSFKSDNKGLGENQLTKDSITWWDAKAGAILDSIEISVNPAKKQKKKKKKEESLKHSSTDKVKKHKKSKIKSNKEKSFPESEIKTRECLKEALHIEKLADDPTKNSIEKLPKKTSKLYSWFVRGETLHLTSGLITSA